MLGLILDMLMCLSLLTIAYFLIQDPDRVEAAMVSKCAIAAFSFILGAICGKSSSE